MERASEQDDYDTRFIYAWIAFNALYGQAREGLPTARSQREYGGGDRDEYVNFLHKVTRLDAEPMWSVVTQLRKFLEQLVACKYLYFCYWRNMTDWPTDLERDIDGFGRAMEARDVARAMGLVFDRLYTLRLQLFHGGATFNSTVNRDTVKLSEMALCRFMRAILEVMINHGLGEDWGEFAYPPRDQPAHSPKVVRHNRSH
jgi:hypothetical protein